MDNYLQQCRNSLENIVSYDSIHVVVGNESCDLDSAVSSLVYAYLLSISKYKNAEKTLVIPVLNITRRDFNLRTELIFWLRDTIQLNLNHVILKEEVESVLKFSGKNILITIVDHNENVEFAKLGKIVEIIDHHKDLVKDRNGVNVEIDASIGSCCTLIAKKYLSYCEEYRCKPDIQVVLILYGPIVFDTVCFSLSAQRFNNEDKEIAQKLETILGPDSFTREELFEQLTKSRNSLANLNVDQILRKDLKTIDGSDNRKLAVSSVSGHLIREVLSEDTFPQPLAAFCENNSFVGVVAMGIKTSEEKVERDLAAFVVNNDLFLKTCKAMEETSSGLKLKRLWNKKNAMLWQQENVTASRKVVLPILSLLIKGDESSERNSYETPNTPEASRRKLMTQVSTADVDPEFLVNYKAETVDFPESPQPYVSGTVPENKNLDKKGKKSLVLEALSKSNSHNGVKSNVNTINGSPKKVGPPSASPSGPPESINYYESYFMDSFVGEFSGEVDVDKVNDNEEISRWCSDSNMDGFNSEMSFDSFGPESLIFASHLENVNEGNENDEAEQNIPTPTNDYDFQSLSVCEPQLGDKVKLCFDESKIKTGYELTAEESAPLDTSEIKSAICEIKVEDLNENEEKEHEEEYDKDKTMKEVNEVQSIEDTPESQNFLRNGPLTQSQRRKISPKLRFEEFLNASDDVNITPTETPHTTLEESIKKYNETEAHETNIIESVAQLDVTSTNEVKGFHVRQNSTTKKRISANRELLDSDDIGIETVENERRKVTFYSNQEPQSQPTEKIAELTMKEELDESRLWRPSCPMGARGEIKRIDMKVIEPYKKVLSHGGYYHQYNSVQLRKSSSVAAPAPAVIIFSACYLPDRSRRDYEYVMDNLFMYVLTTLHELVADDYILIYFHNAGGTGISSNNMPTFSWLKRCYYMIDRRLRKNLKSLFLVHPTFWLKTLVIMSKPFISSKFSRKLQFVNTLSELNDLVPIESTIIPPPVKQVDFTKMIRQKKREKR